MNKENILETPCSYQGGKARLASSIADIIFKENDINAETKFFDLCCGSGAISIELINRGIAAEKITMIDKSGFGIFWESVSKNEFDLAEFKKQIDMIPDPSDIQSYLKSINNKPIDINLLKYHYLLLQSGSFGAKQIKYNDEGSWKGNTFRNLWLPTETSNRRSHVNPMMPMPNSLFERVSKIIDVMSGKILAFNDYVENRYYLFEELKDTNAIVYIDPPYNNTSGYSSTIDVDSVISSIWNDIPIYVSEGSEIYQSKKSWCLSKGRKKGNMNGSISKAPTEEWLSLCS